MMNDTVPNYPKHGSRVGVYTLRSGKYAGLKIGLRGVQPMLLQKVMGSVEIPKRPTYETKSISGKVQHHPMDEQAAKESGLEGLWQAYLEENERALSTQNNRVVTAILVMGTDYKVPDDGWQTIQELLEIEIPTSPDLLKAHFLLTHIDDPAELNDIISEIMRLTGVSEEVIANAEESFQRSVHNEPEGQQQVALAGPDQRTPTIGELASQ